MRFSVIIIGNLYEENLGVCRNSRRHVNNDKQEHAGEEFIQTRPLRNQKPEDWPWLSFCHSLTELAVLWR